MKTRGEERDGHGGERRKNKETLAVCLSLLSNAKEKKQKTSTWAEVQLLASVWRFITLQRGGGGGGREQKVEWRRRWELEKRH